MEILKSIILRWEREKEKIGKKERERERERQKGIDREPDIGKKRYTIVREKEIGVGGIQEGNNRDAEGEIKGQHRKRNIQRTRFMEGDKRITD